MYYLYPFRLAVQHTYPTVGMLGEKAGSEYMIWFSRFSVVFSFRDLQSSLLVQTAYRQIDKTYIDIDISPQSMDIGISLKTMEVDINLKAMILTVD